MTRLSQGPRGKISETLSHGDPLLRRIMRIHLEYNGGHVNARPMIKDGITFYSVGHNASHYFYLGVKDGQMYRCSIDGWYGSIDYERALEAGELDEEGVNSDGSTITEIDPDDFGYIGHF